MEQNDITAYLERKGVKPTANRILVLKTLKESDRPMCLSDLENELITMDKSSIFRVLTLFQEQEIVHTFEDGRGILNYELCTSTWTILPSPTCNYRKDSLLTPSHSSLKAYARNVAKSSINNKMMAV